MKHKQAATPSHISLFSTGRPYRERDSQARSDWAGLENRKSTGRIQQCVRCHHMITGLVLTHLSPTVSLLPAVALRMPQKNTSVTLPVFPKRQRD